MITQTFRHRHRMIVILTAGTRRRRLGERVWREGKPVSLTIRLSLN